MIKIGIESLYNHKGKNQIFVLNDPEINRDNINLPNIARKKYFEEHGYEFNTVDMYSSVDEIDYIIYAGFDKKRWVKAFFGGYLDKVIYYVNEPPAVTPMFSMKGVKILLNAHRYLITWSDKIVDNKRIFKTSFGFCFENMKGNIEWKNKKLLTMIAGCKSSNHPEEMYSERVRIIEHFEKKQSEDFYLYGTGWQNQGYNCYKGPCKNKAEVYHKYKFAVCLENQIGDMGDFSEKIFDCFNAGIVPVYRGCDHDEKYIPSEAYINYKNFKSVEELEIFLKNITEDEYNKYLQAAEQYVNSSAKEIVEPEFYCKQIIKIIEKDKEKPYKLSLFKKMKILGFILLTFLLTKLKINHTKLIE